MTSPSDFLARPSDDSHAVSVADDSIRFYEDVAPLVNEIGRTMCVALDQGHAVVLVVTETTRGIMEEQLMERGIDVDRARRRGQYVFLDAIETLPKVALNGAPDESRFVGLIGGLVDRLSDEYKRVWMFSELSAAMWVWGNQPGALQLEKLWTAFADTHPVCLCCPFPVEVLSWPIVIDKLQRSVAEQLRILAKDSSMALAIRHGPSRR